MPVTHSDAQLVTAYLAGDRSALAGIYDRFADSLYDTAAAMLRDRHEAADAVQDVFLIAAERLGQLRDPERLRPWMFAILRNEVYRRTKRRGRSLPTDFSSLGDGAVPELATQPDDVESVSGDELASLVREAACGLDERDQLVLELSIRQGLQGADLAAALGVTPEQSYTMVHRMRERVDRSLGALVVARAGRKECPELDAVLKGWDGEFTVLVRKRIARHVEGCSTCERTKRHVAPAALLAAAPAFAAPPELRDLVLSKIGVPGASPPRTYRFDRPGGFPRPLRWLRIPLAALTTAGIMLVGVGGTAFVVATDDGPASTGTSIVVEVTTTSTVESTSTTDPTAASGLPTTVPATAAPVPGSVTLSSTSIDLGAGGTTGSVQLFNPGQTPVTWKLVGQPAPFLVNTLSGTLQPGSGRVLTITFDRTGMPEGDVATEVQIAAGGRTSTLKFRARVERAPVISMSPINGNGPCYTGVVISLFITDESPFGTPTATWSGPTSGTIPLQSNGEGAFYGSWILPTLNGLYTYDIEVVDSRGNSSSAGGQLLQSCGNLVVG